LLLELLLLRGERLVRGGVRSGRERRDAQLGLAAVSGVAARAAAGESTGQRQCRDPGEQCLVGRLHRLSFHVLLIGWCGFSALEESYRMPVAGRARPWSPGGARRRLASCWRAGPRGEREEA